MSIALTVNETEATLPSPPNTPPRWVLRDDVMLTDTRYGCGIALCGARTVHMDCVPGRSRQVAIADAVGL